VEDPHFAEEYSAESETGESESENTDLESDLPDLENDPLQSPRIRGVLLSPPHIPVNTRPERECWVCYLSESETPDSGTILIGDSANSRHFCVGAAIVFGITGQ
jgi:hypothetical protein